MHALIQDYRNLHQIPEVGHDLPLTKNYILNRLHKTNATVYEIPKSSIVAEFNFKAKSYIAFRSEMDALPILENQNNTICSTIPNKMHACAHDAHMSILLQLAYHLSSLETSKYNILLIFEEAEEQDGNATRIVDFLKKNNYIISHFFCMHFWPNLEYGTLHSNPSILMSESHEITLQINGTSSHISSNSYEHDALLAGCEFITELTKHLQHIMLNNTRYRFGFIQSGSTCNIVSDKTIIKGSCRTLDSSELIKLQKHIIFLIENIDMKYKTSTTIQYSKGYPIIQNSPITFKKISTHLPIKTITPLYTCESAGEYFKHYKGCYLILGMGTSPSLHSPDFQINESLLTIGFNYYLDLLSI